MRARRRRHAAAGQLREHDERPEPCDHRLADVEQSDDEELSGRAGHQGLRPQVVSVHCSRSDVAGNTGSLQLLPVQQ